MRDYNSLSILIPAYNEQATIGVILRKLSEVVRNDLQPLFRAGVELVIINDGSTDGTGDAVESFRAENPDMDIVYHYQENGGKGTAIRKAIEISRGDIMVVQDADLEYNPKDFLLMLPLILDWDFQVVYGSRFLNHQNRHSYSSFYLGGRLVSITANILFGLHLTDEPTCYKMFTREVADSITLKCTGFEFCPEFTAKVSKAGYHIQEVPIHYYPRSIEEGKKINWKDGVEAFWTLVKYRIVK